MGPISRHYEKNQRQWTLTIVNWIILAAAVLLTLYNLQFNSTLSIISLFLLDIACVIGLLLNYGGRYLPAAVLISAMVLVALTCNIYEGDGLFDPGLVAFPIFVILGSMLFGKRSVAVFTISAIIPLVFIGYLQTRGLIDVTVRADSASNLIPMLIFTVVSGLVVWVILTNMESNLLQIRTSEGELQRSYEMTLYGWAKALEYRDKETEGHSRRVVDLSQKLARALNCSEEEIQNIRQGSILHDIGKMGVPDYILLKPGPLDANEWKIMHQHTQFGKAMLEGIRFLQPALGVVYSHHERWDGSGYPDGLKGEDIPLEARIFAVVDNWDALRSDRPYREAWPAEKVVDYMRQNAGTMFDPHIVEVFLKMENP
jgi:putative nucleotidyltransferase with HDIG domain